MSYKDSNRPPYVEPSGGFHYGNEALERAEYEADFGRYNKKPTPAGLLGRLKALFKRPAR